jgi:hypothetical protein
VCTLEQDRFGTSPRERRQANADAAAQEFMNGRPVPGQPHLYFGRSRGVDGSEPVAVEFYRDAVVAVASLRFVSGNLAVPQIASETTRVAHPTSVAETTLRRRSRR